MEKRAIIAIALSVLVLLAFRYFEERRLGPKATRRPPAQTESRVQQGPTQTQPAPVEEVPQPTTSGGADTEAENRTFSVESNLYRAVIDNRGAVLTSWKLRNYQSAQGLIFEMIAENHGSENHFYPGSVIFDDAELTALANNEFYQVSIDGLQDIESSLSPPVSIVLELKRGDLVIEKRYSFEKDNYLVDLSATLNKGGKALGCSFFLGQDIGPEQEHLLRKSNQLQAVFYRDGKVKREGPPKDENELKKIEGDIRWAGLDMQYFSLIAIPVVSIPYFDIQKLPIKARGLDGRDVDRDLLRMTLPTDGSLQYRIYLGPKKISDLEAVKAVDLERVINYGMFSFLVHPLLFALRWIYQFAHNYGAAIIILTFLISLLLFPIRLKQMLSMKKMQVVQPKVKAIQEKYKKYKKTDPKRAQMNQEIMALYKEHNVNPLGGCLPLILQMPLLFAFYSLLAYSIELRQAPFVLWLQDLSAKDPYYVLPIVMGLTMFVSQKMTPMTPGADPTTSKMMMMMPVVFTIMFFNFSSGLNLYFLCSNIFQVGFQKIAERWLGDGKSKKKPKQS